MAKVGKFCLAKRVKVEWLFHLTRHFANAMLYAVFFDKII